MSKRVLVAEFKHETNVFATSLSDMKAYQDRYLKTGDEVLSFFEGVRTETGGFIDGCRKAGLEMVPAIAANATPGGMVTQDVFDFVAKHIRETLAKNPVDGVLLALHGAMVYEGGLDGEGDILAVVREIVGPDIPVIVTLDLHANITEAMVRNANALVGYDTYPHVDTYERALEAVEIMDGIFKGELAPVMHCASIPILCPFLNSAHEPIAGHMAALFDWEKKPGVICATLYHGFFHADIPEARMSVVAVTNGDAALARQVAEDLARGVTEDHKRFLNAMPGAQEAVSRALAATKGPVVIAETADNPGGGGSGDTTHLLRELLAQGAKDVGFAMMRDAETAQQAATAGIGARISVRLGGKSEALNGEPIVTEAVVKNITDGKFRNIGPMWHDLAIDCGTTAVLDVQGIDVIVCTNRLQPLDPEIFHKNGIDPASKKIIVVKSAQHFRASYEAIASEIIYEDGPGLGSQTPANFNFKHIRRPVFPLDPIEE